MKHSHKKSMQRIFQAGLLTSAGAATLLLSGCASIMHGTTQDIGISSTPTGAQVAVDNKPLGNTPVVGKLSRKENHVIKITMAGYQPYETTATHSVSGWVWGNLVFGGVVGLAVDAISGGLYKLTPEQVSGALNSGNASIVPSKDGIYVMVVLKPQADWTKVAQLTPLAP